MFTYIRNYIRFISKGISPGEEWSRLRGRESAWAGSLES